MMEPNNIRPNNSFNRFSSDAKRFIEWMESEKKFSHDKAVWYYNTFAGQTNTILTYEQMIQNFNEWQENHQKRTRTSGSKPKVDDPAIKAKKLGCKQQFPDCPKIINAIDCIKCPFFPKEYL